MCRFTPAYRLIVIMILFKSIIDVDVLPHGNARRYRNNIAATLRARTADARLIIITPRHIDGVIC